MKRFRHRDARLQSRSFARWSHFRGAPRFDATGAILTRLFGGFAPDFPHYISGKAGNENASLLCLALVLDCSHRHAMGLGVTMDMRVHTMKLFRAIR
jgi:hypothetical protein